MGMNIGSRLRLWGLLFTCSLISMLSIVTTLEKRKEESWERYERWIMSVTCISICISFFGGLASLMPPEQNLKMEAPLILICLGFWSAGMPTLMNAKYELAVDDVGGILNANLYFFGWGALISSILLAGDWAKQSNGDEASHTAVQWICLAASSYILMGTASSLFTDLECKKLDILESTCNRNKFAVTLGSVSGLIAMGMAPLKTAPPAVQAVMALLLLTSWSCGVAYITFGKGPGTQLGNIYFATWISLFLCVNILTTSLSLMISRDGGDDGGNEDDGNEVDEPDEEASKGDAAEEAPLDDAGKAASLMSSI